MHRLISQSPAFVSPAVLTSFLRRSSLRPLCTHPLSRGRPGSGRVLAMAAIDLKFLKENLPAVRQNILDRAVVADADLVASLYDKYVALCRETDALRKARNENATMMKKAGKMEPQQRAACIEDGKRLKAEVAKLEGELVGVEEQLEQEAGKVPNMTHPDVPRGGEEMAKVLEMVGERRSFEAEGFAPLGHLELAEGLDMVDFENAARVAGNKFYYLRNAGALLELALVHWAMAVVMQKGFTVMTTPDVARESVVSGCGFQPRGEGSQVYRIEESDLCLVGTAEIPLGGFYAGQILDKSSLPLKMAAFSHCFRREVGAAGSVTKGLYRVHQFSKVEMFVICRPEESEELLEEMRRIEREMYESLGLCFKVMDMPTQDLGNPAYRKYDIEAWMPGRGAYGEISSASNCTDYQARRLNVRYREEQGDNRFVHTLNATACAVPRMIVAILESFQQKDGSVIVPQVLRPYMGGMEIIRPPKASAAWETATAMSKATASAGT